MANHARECVASEGSETSRRFTRAGASGGDGRRERIAAVLTVRPGNRLRVVIAAAALTSALAVGPATAETSDGSSGTCVGVPIPPGASIAAAAAAQPGGTTFCLSGRYELASPVSPRKAQVFQGPAEIVGVGGNDVGFLLQRENIRLIDLDVSGFEARGVRCMYGTQIVGGRYHHNGVNGIGCGLGRSPGGGVLIDGVEIDHNGSPAMIGHSSSGIKFAGSPGSIVRNSHVHDNVGNGIWFDVDSGGDVLDLVAGNVVTGNSMRGIFYEVSRGPVLITGNTVIGNNTSGKSGASGIGVSSSKNVTIESNVVQDNRVWALRANQINRGYPLQNVVMRGNAVYGGAVYGCDRSGVTCSTNA